MKSYLILILLVIFTGSVRAVTNTAASVSLLDVSNAVFISAKGDTVLIPSGTASWTNTLTITNGITLQGSGMNSTIILDDVISSIPSILELNTYSNNFYRVTGIQFAAGTRGGGEYLVGTVRVHGQSHSFRIDHCKFNGVNNRCLYISENTVGLIDNNLIIGRTGNAILIQGYGWGGGSYGDYAWSQPMTLGSTNYSIYIEANTFIRTNSGSSTAAVTDGYGGARFVYRNNISTNYHVDLHGTGSSGRFRGTRWWEIYGNTLVNTNSGGEAISHRSGSGVVFSNVCLGGWSSIDLLEDYRTPEALSNWHGADGTNAWDYNDPFGVYVSGTNSGTSGTASIKLTGATWNTNQWVGYTIRDFGQTQPNSLYNTNIPRFTCIKSNTADTIYWTVVSSHYGLLLATNGETFEIRHVLRLLDGCGNSKGDLLVNQTENPPTVFLNQTNDPVYAWSNTLNGALQPMAAISSTIREGSEFTNDVIKPGYSQLVFPHPFNTDEVQTNAIIGASPTSLSFGSVIPNSSLSLTFYVTNSGTAFLTNGSASTSSPFSVSNEDYSGLSPNGYQIITVTFSPTSAGNYSGSVICTGGGGATVSLSGSAPFFGVMTKISGNVTISGATVIK